MTLGSIVNAGTPIINSQGVPIVKQTLAQNTVSNINSRLAGKNPSTSMNLFSTNTGLANIDYIYTDGSAIQYVRNNSLWCADITQQLTAIAPWNNVWVQPYPDATLITPRHAITCAHFGVGTGWKYHFVDVNNNIYIRSVQSVVNSPNYAGVMNGAAGAYDYQIMVFDSDLPSAINYLPIVGSSFQNLLYQAVTNGAAGRFPVSLIFRNQFNNIAVRDISFFAPWATGLSSNSGIFYNLSADSLRSQFFSRIIPGDSGDPIALIVNNQIVLLSCNSNANYANNPPDAQNFGQGWNYSNDLANINALIAATDAAAGISTGYQANIFDLSNFPQY